MMKTIVALILSVFSSFAVAEIGKPTSVRPLKVYILAGQSNMVGQGIIQGRETKGTLEHCCTYGNQQKYAFLTDENGTFTEQDDVWIYYENKGGETLAGNLTTGYGLNADTVGLELSFGEQIQKQESSQILIIKTAWGGKSLGKNFRPPSAGGETGFYYKKMVRIIQNVLENLPQCFPDYNEKSGYEISGLAWHQGWSDHVRPALTEEYSENLAHLINDLRRDLKVNFPVVIATTGMPTKRDAIAGDNTKYKAIENAQLAISDAKRFPSFEGNVTVIDTKPFWRPIEECPITNGSQHFHWNKSAAIYLDLGFAIAKAFKNF